MNPEGRADLKEIVATLSRLEGEAKAAGLHLLAMLLEAAKCEAENRLAEGDKAPPPATEH